MDRKTKIGFTAIFILQSVIIFLLYSFMMTRPMLEARKIIQVNNTKALERFHLLTEGQRCEMKKAWERAEYFDEPNIFGDAVCGENSNP